MYLLISFNLKVTIIWVWLVWKLEKSLCEIRILKYGYGYYNPYILFIFLSLIFIFFRSFKFTTFFLFTLG